MNNKSHMSCFTILHKIELPSTAIDKEAELYFRGVMPVIIYGYMKNNSFDLYYENFGKSKGLARGKVIEVQGKGGRKPAPKSRE